MKKDKRGKKFPNSVQQCLQTVIGNKVDPKIAYVDQVYYKSDLMRKGRIQ